MSAYDLEEQEQLAELKAFWKEWGGAILLAILAAGAVIASYWYYNRYQASSTAEANALYAEVQKAAGAKDTKKLRDESGKLIEQYPRSLYAALGALLSARAHFESGDLKTARVQLEWVVDHAGDAEVQAIARWRLAAVLLDSGAHDEALKVLAHKPPASFEPLFEELRGDILVAQGKIADARAAYQAALGKLRLESDSARELVQMKLDGLSGG